MSQQNDLEIRIAAKTDESSIRRAKSAMESLADTSKDSVATINASVRSTNLLAQANRNAARGQGEYNDELRKTISLAAKSTPELDALKNQAGMGGSRISQLRERFGGLGGGGAAKGAVRGLLGGSPIAEVADTLGDLSEVAGSASAALGGGTQALLAMGVAGGIMAGAIAIAASFLAEYNKQAEAQARILGSTIDAQRQLNSEIAAGLTSEQAKEKAAQLNTELELQTQLLADLEAQYSKMSETLGIATGAAQLFDAREEELANQINQQRDLVADLSATQQGYNSAIEEGNLKANDATVAQKALATAQAQVKTATSGLGTETKKTASTIQRAISSIQQANTTGFQDINRSRSNTPLSFSIPKRAAQETDKLAESQTEYANNLIEVNNNVGKSLDDIRLNLSRSIEDLSINTGRSIQDALAEGSFLSIRNIQRDSRREMQDLERQSNRDRLDAQREGALEILRIEQQLAQDRARIAGGTGTTGGVGQLFSRVPR